MFDIYPHNWGMTRILCGESGFAVYVRQWCLALWMSGSWFCDVCSTVVSRVVDVGILVFYGVSSTVVVGNFGMSRILVV